MNVPKNQYYTKEHEWVRVEGAHAFIGITDHAQHELGDIVFVEMPAVGSKTQQFKACASIEAVKAVSDLYAPLSGEVVEVNGALASEPTLINQDPYGKGWIVKIKVGNPKETDALLPAAEYEKLIA